MSQITDEYLKGLLDKDPAVLRTIYADLLPRITSMVLKNQGTRDDARDVFQEGLLIVWRKAQLPDFELTSGFYSFLYGICYFTWQRRRAKKDNSTVTIDASAGLTDESDIFIELETNDRNDLFHKHFRRLDPECRRLLKMFLAGRKMQDIAKSLNIDNDHAARNRKYRCQKKLESNITSDPSFQELRF